MVELAVSRQSTTQMFIVSPIAEGSSFTSLSFRGRIIWRDQRQFSFDAEFAAGSAIAARQFDNTVGFKQLKTPNRSDTMWRAVFDQPQFEALAFYFPSNVAEFKISSMVAKDQDFLPVPETTTPTETTTPCDALTCLPVSNQTAAGVVVGIIGALVVVSLVAAILIWRRRREPGRAARYTPGTHGDNVLYPNLSRENILSDLHNRHDNPLIRNGVSLPVSGFLELNISFSIQFISLLSFILSNYSSSS